MASSKTKRVLFASASVAAASTTNATEWNLSTAYGGGATVRLTNGSSPPTTPTLIKFWVGGVTGEKRLLFSAQGDLVASSVNDYVCEFNWWVMFANIEVDWGATNGGTVEIFGQELTGL